MTRQLAFIITLYVGLIALILPAGNAAPPATQPASKPAIVPAIPRAVSLLNALDMPTDIGMEQGAFLDKACFNLQRDPHTGRQDYEHSNQPGHSWWDEFDSDDAASARASRLRLLKLTERLPVGGLVCVNFENSPIEEYDEGKTDGENERAIARIGQRFRWIRQVCPDLVVDWNTSPATIRPDPFRWAGSQTAEGHARNTYINAAIVRLVIPHVDSVSQQVYYSRVPNARENWRAFAQRAKVGMSGWGRPIRLMVNPGYEWYSPPDLIGRWITGQELTDLLADIDQLAIPVLLWGEVKQGRDVVNQPGDVHWYWQSAAPEWKAWVKWAGKQN